VKPVIGITMGDAAGVGPEVSLKAAASAAVNSCRTVVIGSAEVLKKTAEELKLGAEVTSFSGIDGMSFEKGAVNVLDRGGINISKLKTGMPSAMCGRASVDYIRTAVSLARSGGIDGLATAPISKHAVFMAGIHYAGHTELLEEICGKRAVMAFVSGSFRVALVSRHLPLARVSGYISWSRIVETVKTLYDARGDFGLKKPSFALLSLNPHAGEGGVIGTEDEKKTSPAVKMVRKLGIEAEGPFPADGYFGSGKYKDYDWTVAMYHDQGLIPFKMKTFGRGVNATVGLPVIRTSADHGAAYDIAGRRKADEGSMVSAVKLAAGISAKRKKAACKS
jgi:4-phospho-D-threonate 3-dehydrogenase / 4-phospho-D-erythronate 3-dehydrogenase